MPSWAVPLVTAGLDGASKDVRYAVLERIQELARHGRLDEVDDVLASAPVATLADDSLMTLLRGSYRFRLRLPHWKGFRDRVAREYASRDMPVAELMHGLDG